MNQWLTIRRFRAPAFLVLIGIMFLMNEWDVLAFHRSWPLLLILFGLLSLAERAALARVDPAHLDPAAAYPQQPVYPTGYQAAPAYPAPAAYPPTAAYQAPPSYQATGYSAAPASTALVPEQPSHDAPAHDDPRFNDPMRNGPTHDGPTRDGLSHEDQGRS